MTIQRILKNFLSLTFSQVVTRALGFVVVVYLARVLRADGFGKIIFAQTIVIYFMLLVDLGLNTFGMREIARNRGEIPRHVNNILTVKLLASVVTFALLASFVYFVHKPEDIKKLILFFGLGLFTLAFTIEWVFRGIEKMEFIAISQISRQLVYLSLIFWLVKSPQQLLEVPLINVGAGVVAIVVLFFIFRRNFSFPKPEFDFKFWKEILKQSLPIGFTVVFMEIYYHLDTVMLGFMKDMVVVGWYNAAYKIILLVLGLPLILANSFFPSLARYYNENRNRLVKITDKYIWIMSTIGIPFGFGGTILASSVIRAAYGPDYANSILPLQILSWAIVVGFFNAGYAFPLMAWGKQKRYMKIVGVAAVINTVLNFLLIPRYSLLGASIATVSAELIVFFGAYTEFQKIVKISVSKFALKPIISSIVMTGGLFILQMVSKNVFFLLSVGILIYLLSCFILKVIRVTDIKLILLGKYN